MNVPFEYVYAVGSLALGIPWFVIFFLRPDERKEIVMMSFGIGALSVVTAYHWWTIDWWHPATILGTTVGVEDFIMGFFSGGIIASSYELFCKKQSYRSVHAPFHEQLSILAALAFTTGYLFWFWEFSSFWSTSIALILASLWMFAQRRDLLFAGFVAGGVMALISFLFFYLPIILISPEWAARTYLFEHLSGYALLGIPIEEFVFWFFAGLVFGPWYEYIFGQRQRKISK